MLVWSFVAWKIASSSLLDFRLRVGASFEIINHDEINLFNKNKQLNFWR